MAGRGRLIDGVPVRPDCACHELWAAKTRGDTIVHEEAILQIDHAALALIQALSTHRAEMERYWDNAQMESLQGELTGLRRLLLGLEMGVLYQDWEPPADVLDSVACISCEEAIPLKEAAGKVAEMAKKQKGTQ